MSKIYSGNIEHETLENLNFRKVIFTAPHSQIVLMNLKPKEEIGSETHHKVDQFFRFERGQGKVVVDGIEYHVEDGSAVLVPAGHEHNVINTGKIDLKLYTIYSPANHIDGRIHHTKEDALADEADEAFGE